MLKINPAPEFKVEVKLTEPGKTDTTTIGITFRYKNRDEMIDFGSRTQDKPIAEALAEIVSGWTGIDVDCTAENIALLVKNYLPSGMEILNAYYREMSASRVKN